MRKRNILLLQFVFITIILNANSLDQLQKQYDLRLDQWLNSSVEPKMQLSNLEELEKEFTNANDSWQIDNLNSKTHLLKAQIYQKLKEKKKSLLMLEEALNYGEEANLKKESSDTWRVMSEISSIYMVQKGIFYIMSNFSKPTDMAAKALEIDPTNIRAKLIEAQFLCNAPGIAGGNFDEGIKILLELDVIKSKSKVDSYVILYSLADIMFIKKRYKEADSYITRALEVYPGNRDAMDLKSKTDKKLGVK